MKMGGKRVGISRGGKLEPGTKIRQTAANFEPGTGLRRTPGTEGDRRQKTIVCPTELPRFVAYVWSDVAAAADLVYNSELMSDHYLGEFEQIVLLAVLRLGKDAYGVPIRREIEKRCGRKVTVGALYSTLDRLEAK